MRKNGSPVDIQLVLDRNIVSENSDVLNPGLNVEKIVERRGVSEARTNESRHETERERATHPPSDRGVPADDGAHDPSVLLDGSVGHDHTSLQTNSGSDLASRSDNDVGSDAAERRWDRKVRTRQKERDSSRTIERTER